MYMTKVSILSCWDSLSSIGEDVFNLSHQDSLAISIFSQYWGEEFLNHSTEGQRPEFLVIFSPSFFFVVVYLYYFARRFNF